MTFPEAHWVGHDEAWREWRAALGSQRMHHAWILAGARGLGKGAFARAAARALVAEPGIPQPEGESHPDILVLDHLPSNDEEEKKRDEGKPFQTKRNITIDQIRRMQQRLTTRPTLGSRRAIVIDPADDMEKGAVNALLKSLEEPPVGTSFLLVTHRPGRLLATVRSRCRLLRFAPVGPAEMDAILRREAPQADAATRAAAIAAAEGSPGAALAFVGQDLAPLHTLMQRIIREGDGDFSARGALADEVGARPDRERVAAVLDLARATLAEDLGQAPRVRQLRIIEAHGAIVRLAAQAPTFNFDAGLLVMEIGGLLASAAMPREAAT
ncbi:MAG: DNA polymerase III subunit delta' [Novosphingobium sp.]|nr:DNA polymerase III subunit delta' [Novosphingobium sp.]